MSTRIEEIFKSAMKPTGCKVKFDCGRYGGDRWLEATCEEIDNINFSPLVVPDDEVLIKFVRHKVEFRFRANDSLTELVVENKKSLTEIKAEMLREIEDRLKIVLRRHVGPRKFRDNDVYQKLYSPRTRDRFHSDPIFEEKMVDLFLFIEKNMPKKTSLKEDKKSPFFKALMPRIVALYSIV